MKKESNRNCRRNHTPCGRRRLRGRGALLCIPLFPENRDQRTELRRADRRAGQRGNSEAHCGLYTQHYRARWKNRDIKRHGDRPHVCGRPRGGKTAGVPEYSCMACILLEREKENQVAADSVYDKEMVQEKTADDGRVSGRTAGSADGCVSDG